MDKKLNKKQIANATFAVPIVLSVLTQGLPFAENDFLNQKAEASSVFSGGDGSETNPYIITTPEQLKEAINNYPTSHFKLGSDIDMGGTKWTLPSAVFSGTFDGAGYTIKNLNKTRDVYAYSLFNNVKNAKITNIKLKDLFTSVSAMDNVGSGLIAVADNTQISNITVDGFDINSQGKNVGAIVGTAKNSTIITNAVVTNGKITNNSATSDSMGGVVGCLLQNSTIKTSFSSQVTISSGGTSVGGIAGSVNQSSIDKVFASGTFTASAYAGGIAGVAGNGSLITNAFSNGVINTVNNNSGGIVGAISTNTIVRNIYSTASIQAKTFAAGLIGSPDNTTTIENGFAINPIVKGTTTNPSGLNTIGQAIGGQYFGQTKNIYSLEGMQGNGKPLRINGTFSLQQLFQRGVYEQNGFDFSTPIWGIDENISVPYISELPIRMQYDSINKIWTNNIVETNHLPVVVNHIHGKTIYLNNSPQLQVDLKTIFSDADGDTLSYSVVSGNTNVATTSINNGILTLNGVSEGTTTITVTADDGKGGTIQDTFTVQVIQDAPVVEFTKNTFTFASVPNATEYIILRNGVEIARIPDDGSSTYSYIDTNLTPGQTYSYDVQPVYATGEGTPIDIGTFETLSMDISTLVNQNDVTVSWTPISEAEGYRIIFKNSNGQVVSSQEVANNVTSITKTLASAGNYVVEITPKLNGAYGEGQTDSFTIAKDLNHNPTASAIPNQTLKVTDSPKTIDLKNYFSDSDGDPLSFTVSSNNGNVTVSNNGSQITITPKSVGTSMITVTADDGKGGTVQQTFTVTVQEVAPAAVQNLQVVANSYNQVTVTFNPSPRADEYIIKRNGQEVTRITGTSYVDNNVAAETTYNYEVIAVNEAGQSTPASMSVVTPKKPNTNPTASAIPNQTLKVTDSPKTIDMKNYFSDADGDTLTFSVQANNGNVTVSNNGSQVTITPKAVGTSTITVTANDGKGGTVQQTFTVTVQEVAPAAVQNLQVVANSYNQVTVTFSPVANADEYIIKRNGQEVARITGTSYTDNNVSADTTYNYEVIAVNEAGQSSPASMSVVTPKKPNNAPTASAIPNQTLKVTDSPKTIDVKNYFNDADGDTLSFSVQTNNGNVTVSNNGSQVTITPKAVGTSMITVTADDGKGGTVQQTFTVTVQEVAPATVQNIQVALDGTKATVTWDAFPNATGYRVQRYVKNSDGQFVKDGFARSVTSTTYEDTTLVAGKEYQYEITPRTNVYLTGSAGLSAPVVVPSSTPEEPPTGGGDNGTSAPSVQVQVNGSTVTVTWPAMDGVTRYRVERFKKDANGQYARDGVAKSVSETTVTETLPNGEYKYVITPRVGYVYDTDQAMEGFGTVGGTSTGGGGSTTSPAAMYVPNVHAIVNGTKVTLQWDSYMLGQQAAAYYRVIRYVKDEQGQFVQDGAARTINGTSLEDTIAANKEYRYEVIPRGNTTYLFDQATKVSLSALTEGERKVFAADHVFNDGRTQIEVQRYVKDGTTGHYVADGQPFTVNQLSFVDPNPIDGNKEYKYTFK